MVASQSVAYNGTATVPTAPTKTGNTFAGWYSDAALTTAFVFTTPIVGDTTLYAKWTVIIYTVAFTSNGGNAVASQSVPFNTAATTPTAPTKAGSTFAGWYSDAALTTVFVFTTPIVGDTTLYTKWTVNSYTVSFTSNGGSAVASQSVAYSAAATTPTAPTKAGNTFAGWYSDVALTSALVFTTPIVGDTTLYAKWTVNSYTVSFTSNGGSAVISQSVAYSAEATTPTAPTKTGNTFAGWFSDAALTTVFDFTTPIVGDMMLYAKWTAVSYTVTFTSNGGTVVASQSVSYNTTATTPTAPTKAGSTFAGWYSDVALTSAFIFTTPIVGDTTLYAKWTVIIYTVSFTSNDGGAVASQSVAYNGTATVSTAPTKTGNTFAGWFSDAALTTVFDFTTPIVGDMMLYAKWTAIAYPVIFASNGGSAVASQSVAYNTAATTPTAPTKIGYTFTGWYSDVALTTAFVFTTSIVGDTTLYAQWTENSGPTLSVSTLADGSVTSNATLNVSGMATDINSVLKSITVNGQPVSFDNSNGSFSTSLTLNSGVNQLTVVATNTIDLQTSKTRTITYDPTAPLFTVTGQPDNSTTDQATITITGTIAGTGVDKMVAAAASPISTVTVTVNDGSPQFAAIIGNTYTATVNFATGMNTIQITATDQVGKQASMKRTLVYSHTLPALAITYPAQDITTDLAILTMQGTVSDTLTTVSITQDGKTFTPPVTNGAFRQELTLSTFKQYAIVVTATDQAGNSSTVQRNVIFDGLSGDINGDKTTDVFDALLTLQYAVGLIEQTSENNAKYLATADVAPLDSYGKPKGDGKVDVFDALAILRHAVGLDLW